MSIKQAIIYNLVSAVLAYLGLIAGILLGGSEMGRHFILSITAGLFLYVSLADMVRLNLCLLSPEQSSLNHILKSDYHLQCLPLLHSVYKILRGLKLAILMRLSHYPLGCNAL